MTDYLNMEKKVMVANSKVESVEVECSQLRKDLIVAMNERNKVHEKIKELTEALRVEKALVVQKDEEFQVSLLKTDMEKDKVIQKFKQSDDFSGLQFIQYFKGIELLRQWTMKHIVWPWTSPTWTLRRLTSRSSLTRLRSGKKTKLMPWRKTLLKEKTPTNLLFHHRSEERRVGKECVP